MRNTFKQGGTMIAVESAPAVIDFQDILDKAKVVSDNDFSEAPWDNCDGLEHTATPTRRYRDEANTDDMQGNVYCDGHRERLVITLPDGEDYGVFDYMRNLGASRQVARESVAANRRRTLDQLVKWYGQGWEWWGVRCTFTILGDEYESSLWGIDDADYAEREITVEMALDVAAQLEKAGYTVTNQPEGRGGWTRADKRDRITRNLSLQNWRA